MKKVKWLERSVFKGGYLTLVTSQEEFDQALKHIKLTDHKVQFVPNGWPACTHSFDNVDGSVACIVAIDMTCAAKADPIDIAALLVHEAVHVWQTTESAAGKMGCFGTEGEAYGIQNISAELMRAYKEKIK